MAPTTAKIDPQLYGPKRRVAVIPYKDAPFLYGFLSSASKTLSKAAGYVELNSSSAPTLPVIFGAQYPKPGRIEGEKGADAGKSTYADFSKVNNPDKNYKRIAIPQTKKLPTASNKSIPVYVEIRDPTGPPDKFFKYVFRVNTNRLAYVKDAFKDLGIVEIDSKVNPLELCYGVNYPKPSHACTEKTLEKDGETFTSQICIFVATSKIDNLPDGWTIKTGKNSRIILPIS
ncbi:MAG: hypothetical protein F6J93_21975 [Oscillatoria sp. SIO1A7]|nr:hypothetical protein [Oscillatoria sp. SIO1A7]